MIYKDIYVPWQILKTKITFTFDNFTYVEYPDKYEIYAVDKIFCYICILPKNEQPGSDLQLDLNDFEQNYKDKGNLFLSYGVRDFSYSPLREWQSIGVVYEVQPPEAGETFRQNIFDFRISEEIVGKDNCVEIVGGQYYIRNIDAINEADIMEFSVVDKDDVLGLFQYYRLTVGTDVLELAKFVRTHSVIGGTLVRINPGQSKILPLGLYLRTSYISYGSVPFKLKIDFFLPR